MVQLNASFFRVHFGNRHPCKHTQTGINTIIFLHILTIIRKMKQRASYLDLKYLCFLSPTKNKELSCAGFCGQYSVKMSETYQSCVFFFAADLDWLNPPLLLISYRKGPWPIQALTGGSSLAPLALITLLEQHCWSLFLSAGARSSTVDQRKHPESRLSSHRTQLKKKASIFHQTTLCFWSRSKPRLPQSYR